MADYLQQSVVDRAPSFRLGNNNNNLAFVIFRSAQYIRCCYIGNARFSAQNCRYIDLNVEPVTRVVLNKYETIFYEMK